MKTFTLPDLGEGLQDAEVVAWHVSEGARVVADQPLVSVETQKALVEVPAPWSGTVTALHAKPGDIIEVGAPVADFDIEGIGEDAGAVVGTLSKESAAAASGASRRESPGIRAVPAARKLAADRGVDLAAIKGTGPNGTITLGDVEAAAAQPEKGGYEPLRRVRRAMARNMARAHAEVATTNVTDEANLSAWKASEDVTLRLVLAIAAACKAEPALNAWYDGKREARLLHAKVDLGIATNTEEGLFVPVLRDAGNRSKKDLRAGLDAMRKDVEARTIPVHELRDQTITLSNFGMIGGRHANLVVMPPQVAIVGAGRITTEPRVREGKVVACRVMPLSLTFDHRAVTGAEAARFLMTIVKTLEE